MASAALHLLGDPATRADEYYTPASVCRVVHRLFGGPPALDPASCAGANRHVRARTFYTREQNGLLQDWTADTLWLNPPFSAKRAFVEKLHSTYQDGRIGQALCLLPAALDTAPWQGFARHYWWCAWTGRIQFGGLGKDATFASTIIYLGRAEGRFAELFSWHGLVFGPARCLGKYRPVQGRFDFIEEQSG